MAHRRGGGAERFEQLDLGGRIGHMVLAADDMGNAVIDVVDNRCHGVDHPAVLAHQNRIGQAGHVIADIAAHHVGPADLGIIQQEPPVRAASCRLMLGLLFIRQLQRRAVIDRRPPGRQLRLALQRQLFGLS